MHPALSVIFFTTLSGAGYGLLAWAAVAALTGQAPARPLLAAVVLALVLSTLGLVSSLFHLGKPGRAWRAFSQWRTSWLSREGVASLATAAVAVALFAALLPGMLDAMALGASPQLGGVGLAVALLAVACAIGTVYCTAMIYASLKPIPAWRHPAVPIVYLLFAAFTGGVLFRALLRAFDAQAGVLPVPLVSLAVLLALLKVVYWRAIDRAPLPATRGDAVGLPQRRVEVFERPHTEANYLTREMAFVVARRHARLLRALALLLFAVVPVLLLLTLLAGRGSPALWWLAVVAAVAGTFLERWLFFAEAKHLVSLYY
ncbi:MAG TPA: DmsC/YnfH family molybdoenzyme membrane anchor subunit [Xanthomonadaceae bacterium]|nr:DmsC/YnfH family molybdoenzyme membrane anchor subunit [Xanthomonadaceae bacterium]